MKSVIGRDGFMNISLHGDGERVGVIVVYNYFNMAFGLEAGFLGSRRIIFFV